MKNKIKNEMKLILVFASYIFGASNISLFYYIEPPQYPFLEFLVLLGASVFLFTVYIWTGYKLRRMKNETFN